MFAVMNEGARTTTPERLVPLGEIVGTHGVGGLLRFHPYSDPAVLTAPRTVYLEHPAALARGVARRPTQPLTQRFIDREAVRLVTARQHGRVVLLGFAGVDSIDLAPPFVGTVLSIAERDLPPVGPAEFYAYQLEGLDVVTESGERLGTVAHSFATGSNDVLVVRDGNSEHLIPVIADVVRRVDLERRTIVIEPIAGLLD